MAGGRGNFLAEVEAVRNDASKGTFAPVESQATVDDNAVQVEESQLIEVAVELLNGAVVIDQLKVPLSTSIFDLKAEIEQREGTPVNRQQLIFECNVLDGNSTCKELGFREKVTLSLIRRSALQFTWDISAHSSETVPELLVSQPFEVGNNEQTVTLEYYPRGCPDNKLCKQTMCSVYLKRPASSVLHCRVSVGEQSREGRFISTQNRDRMNVGWTNFCEQPKVQPERLVLDVMHIGIADKPVVTGEMASWDLRKAFGGMPFSVGEQFKSPVLTLGDTQLSLVFFPGGNCKAPAYHTSLWVVPIKDLFDRRYRCIVDGCASVGNGESLLHFPRVEHFGEISIQLLAEHAASS
eukprot:gnl/MRDRNA2_/MRDRNA2_101007_c0_seq1.p1 gnl/MRDRNA2_/MRDRNA2_101007_c0~~gnl/MRDRNA2_/MRDRNA2_101007_c0_seq1.p1  ORF type:complete len:352 (+),score=43.90 gnl/MRDRNA2_/MRDRNA2_101007_c0_seq1:87-1142(+)